MSDSDIAKLADNVGIDLDTYKHIAETLAGVQIASGNDNHTSETYYTDLDNILQDTELIRDYYEQFIED